MESKADEDFKVKWDDDLLNFHNESITVFLTSGHYDRFYKKEEGEFVIKIDELLREKIDKKKKNLDDDVKRNSVKEVRPIED